MCDSLALGACFTARLDASEGRRCGGVGECGGEAWWDDALGEKNRWIAFVPPGGDLTTRVSAEKRDERFGWGGVCAGGGTGGGG